MAARVGVTGVDRIGQRLEGRDDDFFAVLEEPRIVDRDRRLRRQFRHQVAVVVREDVPDLVVGEEEHALRFAAQGDRHAKHRPRVQRAVVLGFVLHRLHHRIARAHDVPTDLTAKAQRQAFRGSGVRAEPALQDELARVFEGQTADLGRRRFRSAGQHLLQDLVQVEGGCGGLQRLLQVLQLPDAALVVVVQLRIPDRDHALVAERREHALVIGGPLAFLDVENRQRAP